MADLKDLKKFFDFSEERKSFEGRNYKPSTLDILARIIDSTFGPKGGTKLVEKLGIPSSSWNKLVEDVNNITVKFFGDQMELMYHCVEKVYNNDPKAFDEVKIKTSKFLSECEKVIKKDFKEAANTTLKIKKVNKEDDYIIEQLSFSMPWTSFMGSFPKPQPDSFVIRTRRIYKINE